MKRAPAQLARGVEGLAQSKRAFVKVAARVEQRHTKVTGAPVSFWPPDGQAVKAFFGKGVEQTGAAHCLQTLGVGQGRLNLAALAGIGGLDSMAHGSNQRFGFCVFARRVKGPWRLDSCSAPLGCACRIRCTLRWLQTADPRRAIGFHSGRPIISNICRQPLRVSADSY